VLDVWFEREVKSRLSGKARLIRYADDAVLLFADEKDARRVLDVLPKRFGKYGLALHPEKTRLVKFRRPDRRSSGSDDDRNGPGTFDLLGFTHYSGASLAPASGSSNAKQPKTASEEHSRGSHSGAGSTATTESASSSRRSGRSYGVITGTSG